MNEFWNVKKVKPRKNHRCDVCGKVIAIGEHCMYESGKFDGDFQSLYLCMRCYDIKEHYCHENRDYVSDYGWNSTNIIEDIRERICTECDLRKDCPYKYSKCIECKKAVEEYMKWKYEKPNFWR